MKENSMSLFLSPHRKRMDRSCKTRRSCAWLLDASFVFQELFLQGLIFLGLVAAGWFGHPCELMANEMGPPDFTRDIAPILQTYCVGCHGADEPEGKLSLADFAGISRGGEHGETLSVSAMGKGALIRRLTGEVTPKMPPDDEPQPSAAEIAMVVRWVEMGAPGPHPRSDSGADVDRQAPPFAKIAPSTLPRPVTAVEFSPSGRWIAVGRYGEVSWMDADLFAKVCQQGSAEDLSQLLRSMRTVSHLPGKIHNVRFNASETHLVIATGVNGWDGEALLYRLSTGELERTFRGHRDAIYAIAISHDQQLLATGGYDRQIILWNLDNGTELRTLKGHNGAIFGLRFSPDDRVLASASADATVKLWRVSDGERLDTLSQPLKEQNSVDISPEGRSIVAAGEDNRIRMWDFVSVDAPQINPLRHARFAHEVGIQQVQFTRDGKFIVSVASDHRLKIWDADTLTERHVFHDPHDSPQALAVRTTGQGNIECLVGWMDGSIGRFEWNQERSEPTTTTSSNLAKVSRSVPQNSHLMSEMEPNNSVHEAMSVTAPVQVSGVIAAPSLESADEDYVRFTARQGEIWVMEVQAARDGSPLDSHLSVMDAQGKPIPRVQLRAVRDSYFTFRGKDSKQTGDFRLHNWEEMQLNQLLYANGEVVRLYHYPRGPDSGFNVYPNFGNRYAYFDTTPTAHALHEPCYIVEPLQVGDTAPPNGLPTFTLFYENDDECRQRWGRDSLVTFQAPADGDYWVRIRDVRGFQGEDFKYTLKIRPQAPDFRIRITGQNPEIPRGSGKSFGIEVERMDGFDGPIQVDVTGLPPGISIAGPLQVESGHERAWGVLIADPQSPSPTEAEMSASILTARAEIEGRMVEHPSGSLGKIQISDPPKLVVQLTNAPSHPSGVPSLAYPHLPVIELHAGQSTTALARIERRGFEGSVSLGNENGAVNAPHGVFVDNIGLNGVLITPDQSEREFFLRAEPWVEPGERLIFVETGEEGRQASRPVVLRMLAPQ